MSEVLIQKVATAMRCICGHLWLTTSKSKYKSCPRCHIVISRKKLAVILESHTTRNQKSADSGSHIQNTAGVVTTTTTTDRIDNERYSEQGK